MGGLQISFHIVAPQRQNGAMERDGLLTPYILSHRVLWINIVEAEKKKTLTHRPLKGNREGVPR